MSRGVNKYLCSVIVAIERVFDVDEVRGSNPLSPTIIEFVKEILSYDNISF